MKVVRMHDARPKEATHVERSPGIQQTQVDVPETEAREIASQLQALEAMRQAERAEEERAKIWKIGTGRNPKNKSLTERLSNAAKNMQGQKAEIPLPAMSSSSTSMDTGVSKEKKHIGDRSTPADRWLRPERIGRNSEIEHSQKRPGPLQATLTKFHIEYEKDGTTVGAKKTL